MKKEENNMMNFDDESLTSIPKKQVFEVPDGYFEKLPLKVQDRVDAGKESVWEKIAGILFRPQIVVATAFVLVLTVVGIKYYHKTDNNPENLVAFKTDTIEKNITHTEDIKIEDLSRHQVEQIDQEIIAEEIDEKVILEEEIKGEVQSQVALESKEGNSEEVDFLIDNNIDVSSIIDELQID